MDLFRLDEETYAAFSSTPALADRSGLRQAADKGQQDRQGRVEVGEGEEGEQEVEQGTSERDEPEIVENVHDRQWSLLSSALGERISGLEDNPRSLIVFEFIFHVVQFCSSAGFNFEQMSTVLGIFGEIFVACIINTRAGKSREDAVSMFKELIAPCGRRTVVQPTEVEDVENETSPSQAPPLLDVEAITSIARLLADSLIKQFDAYQFVMTDLPVEVVEQTKLAVQTPMANFVALDDALLLPDDEGVAQVCVEGSEAVQDQGE